MIGSKSDMEKKEIFKMTIHKGTISEKRSQWAVMDVDGIIHVVPTTDILPHGKRITDTEYELSADCACQPRIETEYDEERLVGTMVVHNSFEDMERIKRTIEKYKI